MIDYNWSRFNRVLVQRIIILFSIQWAFSTQCDMYKSANEIKKNGKINDSVVSQNVLFRDLIHSMRAPRGCMLLKCLWMNIDIKMLDRKVAV